MANANKVFNGRNDSIKFVDDSVSMILEAKKIAAKEELEPEPPKVPSLKNMNILQVRKCCLLIKDKQWNKLSL